MTTDPDLGPAFFRIVHAVPPPRLDFESHALRYIAGKGRSLPDDGDVAHMWSGISTYRNEERARTIMARRRALGSELVSLQIPAHWLVSRRIVLEKTGGDPFHWTIWGTPEDLLACAH